MLHSLRARLERDEDGFTLIELMVVVLIIAILLAIAIPTFLGARNRANDRAAQSSLRNALTSAKTIFTDAQDYTQASSAALTPIEPSLTFVDHAVASATAKTVSVDAVDANNWAAAAMSASGTCFYIKDTATTAGGGTHFGSGTTCTGDQAATSATNASW